MNTPNRSSDNTQKRKKLLFLFPGPAKQYVEQIEAYEIPSERLYGVMELQKNGWNVEICDNRFEGMAGSVIKFFRKYAINLIAPKTICAINKADIVIVKDRFSLMTSLTAKLLGKKLVYYDSMRQVPKRFWRKCLVWLSLKLADAVIGYSKTQIQLWAKSFNLPETLFHAFRYTIDTSFYQCPPAKTSYAKNAPYILAVGRDMGRDFLTLARALEGSKIGLKLVTLPYLVTHVVKEHPWVEIYERLSYDDLFKLYRDAQIVVIPLKEQLSYPSGIRGVLEAMALGKATICTRTAVLEESFTDGKEIVFVTPNDAETLRKQIMQLCENEHERQLLERNAQQTVNDKYTMSQLIEPLEQLLNKL